MSAVVDGFQKEEHGFTKIHANMQERECFEKFNTLSSWYVHLDSRETKYAARRAFGPNILNYPEAAPFF